MMSVKTLLRLTAFALIAVACTAPAANAWFEAGTSGATKGTITKFPAKTIINLNNEPVTCESTANTKAAGTWTIQTAVESKSTKEIKQPATKLGPHEALTIEKWGACTGEGAEQTVGVSVSECRLQIAQPSKGSKEPVSTASIQTVCSIELVGCKTFLNPGAPNTNLSTVGLANSKGGVEIKLNLSGLIGKTESKSCGVETEVEVGITTGTKGEEALFTAGQKLV